MAKKRGISIKQKQILRIPKYLLILKTALILGVTLSGFTSDKSPRPTSIHKRYSLYTIYVQLMGLKENHLCNNTTLPVTLSRLY
jgi:hypothetical protein